jgi:hypothetical protein
VGDLFVAGSRLILPLPGNGPCPGSGLGRAERGKRACDLIQAFVFEGFFGLLVFAQVFGASGFAATETDPVFCRTALAFGALAFFLILVEIDDHRPLPIRFANGSYSKARATASRIGGCGRCRHGEARVARPPRAPPGCESGLPKLLVYHIPRS